MTVPIDLMTGPITPPISAQVLPPAERRRRKPQRERRHWFGVILWFSLFAVYSTIGLILNLKYQFTINDGLSRVANASYILYGADPHFSAVGFVWNPLPSVLELPLIAARSLWQPLVTRGCAGVFMSSAMMAGTVIQMRAIVRDRTQSRPWIFGITCAFVFHPMILIYAGNGMSEAPYLFFTTWAVRRLIRFLNYNRVLDLASCGLALGLDYLTRYEALFAGVAAVGLVAVVTAIRTEGTRGRKVANAIMDGSIVGFPILVTFSFWTVASYVITGDAFLQFSSVYGNASQAALGGLSQSTGYEGVNSIAGGAVGLIAQHVLSLEPLIIVIVIVGLVFAVIRSDPAILAPLAIYGATLAFEAYGYLSATTFPWLRFYMMCIPLAVIVAGQFKKADDYEPAWTPLKPELGSWRYRGVGAGKRPIRIFRTYRLSASVAAAALLLPSIPVAAAAVVNPNIGIQEFTIRSVLDPGRYPSTQQPEFQDYDGERELASFLDTMHNGRGTVLVDTFLGWPIVMGSTDPNQFVITSDLNFSAALNSPRQFGIKYFLVPSPAQYGTLDAINRRYPGLWPNGGSRASLVLDIPSTGYSSEWRLFRMNYVHSSSLSP